jgi:hypothetical protein
MSAEEVDCLKMLFGTKEGRKEGRGGKGGEEGRDGW